MNATQFILSSVNGLHQAMINDVKILNAEQLKWKPAAKANPIGFLFWHAVRVEDNTVAGWQKKSTVWEEDKWYEKMGLDAKVYGTGFGEEDVNKIAKLPVNSLMEYAEKVFRNSASYIQGLEADKLDYAPNPERPNWTVGMMISNFIIAHGWWHLGEIRYVKGLQGMPAPR